MESIEKLREYTQDMRKRSVTPGHNPCADKVDDYLDEIEREIAERYMELPVDTDGVSIHVGDTLQLGNTRGEVVALTYCPSNGKLPWEWQNDTGDWYYTAFAHHVKSDPVKELLEEFALDIRMERFEKAELTEQTIEQYAARIREAVEK